MRDERVVLQTDEETPETYGFTEKEMAQFRKESFQAIEGVKEVVAQRRGFPVFQRLNKRLALAATGAIAVLAVIVSQLIPSPAPVPTWVLALYQPVRSPLELRLIYPVRTAVSPEAVECWYDTVDYSGVITLVVEDRQARIVFEQDAAAGLNSVIVDALPAGEYYWFLKTEDPGTRPNKEGFKVLDAAAWQEILDKVHLLGLDAENFENEISLVESAKKLDSLAEVFREFNLVKYSTLTEIRQEDLNAEQTGALSE